MEEKEYIMAKKAAFRLLSMRSYHSQVLFRKLEEKGFAKEVCEAVIAECQRLGFLNDDAFILRELRRGYGPRYIEWKLRVRKVRDVISREMQREQIRKMAAKVGPREKAMRTLQRRGFDLDLIIEFFS